MIRIHPASIVMLTTTLLLCACNRQDETVAPAEATSPAATTPVEVPPSESAPPAPAPATADENFRKMDTNGDGSITADEHAQGAKSMFDSMDADKNGTVTAQEMDASRAAMGGDTRMSSADKIKTIDANDDGAISAEEHANGSRAMFEKMDTDKSGQLSAAEVQAGHDKMMSEKQ